MDELEDTPLLEENNENRGQTNSHLNQLAKEPLTPLTRVLFVLVLILLLLTSILLGISIGLEQKLATGSGEYPVTTTRTATFTVIPSTSSIPLPRPTNLPDDNDSVCLRSECVLLAASVIEGMDTSKDPCHDFYEYSNGKWLQNNPLPPGKERFGSFGQLQDNNDLLLEHVLTESREVPSPDSETLSKLRKFYRSCLDESYLNTLGDRPLLDVATTIKKLFNGSTTTLSPRQRIFQAGSRQGLTAALAYLHSRGIQALFGFSFDGDAAVNPNTMVLWFSQTILGLEAKEYYQNTNLRDVYVSTLTRIFEALEKEETQQESKKSHRNFWPPFPWPPWGDGDEDTKPNKTPPELAEAVVDFETNIAEASLDLVSLQLDPMGTYNPISHEEFAEMLPQVDFPAYWSSFAPRSYPSKVIVTYKPYLASLSNLLSNTSSDVVEAYLIGRASLHLAEYLGPQTEIWKAHRSLIEAMTGISTGSVQRREEYCIAQMTDINTLGLASGRFFVLEAFSRDAQADAREIMTNIIQSFKQTIQNVDWMDKGSAEAAVEKASNIHVNVGYPSTPNTEDAKSIANYFSKLTIDESNFFGNILNSWTFSTTQNWQLLGKQRNYGRFQVISPSTVNAYFDPLANMIVIPAGILRHPFYQLDWPGYMKYGAFGAVASHELTHAFDSAGRFYDQNAKLNDWWSNATSEAFEERRACLSQQYSSYTVVDSNGNTVHLNGNLTSGEDISDSAFVQAYRAWKRQYAYSYKNGHEYSLPGLDKFTREQLFFIAFARIWAENLTTEAAIKNILTNPHSLGRYRTLGTLVNMPEFAEAFQCPVNSKYNPPAEDRCKFW